MKKKSKRYVNKNSIKKKKKKTKKKTRRMNKNDVFDLLRTV